MASGSFEIVSMHVLLTGPIKEHIGYRMPYHDPSLGIIFLVVIFLVVLFETIFPEDKKDE